MKAFSYEHSYRTHHQFVSRYWLMTLQYIFFTVAIACIIASVWMLDSGWYASRAAVTTVVLLIAGAVCKSGRQ